MLVGASCTAELIQDDPGGLAKALDLPIPVVPLELPSYQKKENWGAAETFYQLVRALAGPPRRRPARAAGARAGARPRCNLLGPTALGFRHRDDVQRGHRPARPARRRRQRRGAAGRHARRPRPAGRGRLQRRALPEIAGQAARWLERTFGQPWTRTVPIGVGATARLRRRGRARSPASTRRRCSPASPRACPGTRARSIRPTSPASASSSSATPRTPSPPPAIAARGAGLHGGRASAPTAASSPARCARPPRRYGVEALITDDYLEVEAKVAELQPELVLGTQMERHIAKRLGIPCAVISAPGPRAGLPRPLLAADGLRGRQRPLRHLGPPADDGPGGASARHVPRGLRVPRRGRALASRRRPPPAPRPAAAPRRPAASAGRPRPRRSCGKIPFFVRGKARRNTERFAARARRRH